MSSHPQRASILDRLRRARVEGPVGRMPRTGPSARRARPRPQERRYAYPRHPRSGLRRTFGPVDPAACAEHEVMSQEVPVADQRLDEHPLPWSRPGLLVGVDGSPASLAALRVAVDMGPKLDLPVHALVVWGYVSPLAGRTVVTTRSSRPEADARGVVDAARRSAFAGPPPDWFTIGLERGRPAFVLLQHSSNSEMLIIGSRGHGGFTGLLLGSVSSVCVAHALCPVLIVRERVSSPAEAD